MHGIPPRQPPATGDRDTADTALIEQRDDVPIRILVLRIGLVPS
jgi:hypothetical protein